MRTVQGLKKFSLLSLPLLLCFLLSCTLNSQKNKTFVYCSEGSPKIFNPQLGADGPSFEASGQTVYNRLVALDKKNLQLIPSLATSWKVSSDGLKITFHLRKNVVFHTTKYFSPKRKFNADDVLFSFNRMKNPKHPYHKVNGGNYQYFQSLGWDELIQDIVKLKEDQVQFVLKRPNSPFLVHLAGDAASVLSAEYGEFLLKKNLAEKIDLEPIGTGPFIFKSYLKDNKIRYVSNPHYFLGKTPIDYMVFTITPDSSVRFQKLKRGECHVMKNPSPTDVSHMKKHPKIKILKETALNIGFLAFNVKKKPFDQIFVRRAIYHALNRQSYVQSIYLGHAIVAKNPIPPHMWGYNNEIKDYEYNLDKARAFLKKSSYPHGFSTELWTLPIARPYNPNGKKMGELMQADLAKIGIHVKLITYKWATYLDKVTKGEHKMVQFGWSSENADPSGTLEILLTCKAVLAGTNASRWCNKDFDQWVEEASRVSSLKKRILLYKKAQEIFHRDLPWVPIAHSQVFIPIRKNVINFTSNAINLNSFYGVDYSLKTN